MRMRRLSSRLPRGLFIGLVVAQFIVGGVACSSDTDSPKPTQETSPMPAQEMVVMPDLVGLYWKEAGAKLREIGWSGVMTREPDMPVSPDRRWRITRQEPPAGEQVARDGSITLQFGS